MRPQQQTRHVKFVHGQLPLDPPARTLISEAVWHWIHSEQPYTPDILLYPEHLHCTIKKALKSQSWIGWDALMKGYISTTHWRLLDTLDSFIDEQCDQSKGDELTKQLHISLQKYLATHIL
jgi:hypothetical protein